MTQGKALKEQYGNDQSADTNSHARMVAESIKGKHIPGVSDVSSSDMAALAGVKQTTTSTQPTPTMNVMNTAPITSTSTTDKWNEVDARLSNIESKLSSIVESIQRLSEISDEDYREKRKALHDLEMNPQLQDKESKEAIKKRKLSLEKERKETTKESLEKGFASFLKELEKN
jgi:hypothetical protein